MEEQQPPSFLLSGTRFDLTKFLVDYTGGDFPTLIRNDNQTINTYRMGNRKVMMLCFFCLPLRSDAVAIARALSLVSSEMHAFGAFELIIFVDYITDCDDQDVALSDFISSLPSFCLTPKSTRRLTLGPTMPFACYPHGLLVNRAQMVEWHKPLDFLLKYGVDAFPFTSERLLWISRCDERAVSRSCLAYYLYYRPLTFPSLLTFLRKYPGGDTEKATISDLQDKCVGLYLCRTGNLIPTLDNVHKKCCELGQEFEIILVYMPFSCFDDDYPQLFQDRINSTLKERNISWWVFPFIYWVSRRLSRLSHQDADDQLIIIDPKSKYVEFHGEAVIRHHGASAYPFSRDLLINREVERLRAVTLESLLVYRSLDYVLWMGSGFTNRVPVAALQGRTVFIYLHCAQDHSLNCFDKLVSYCQMKALDPNFDMVFVGLDTSSIPDVGNSCEMPWLVYPWDPNHSDYVTRTIFGKGDKCSTIIAFGKDGRISSLLPLRLVCSSCPDFPLCNNLHNEMSAELPGSEMLYADANSIESSNQEKALLPLLGEEYFFPDLPVRGRMKPSEMQDFYDCAGEDELDQYLASKTEFICVTDEDAQYPKAINEKVASIDASNFDVISFLSAANRQYLIRNDGRSTLFKVVSLREKKWVMICCLSCPIYFNSDLTLMYRGVSDICYELYDGLGDTFEMVLVCKMIRDFEADRSSFNHMLSGFPKSCLVVPFWDSSSRDAICCSLGFSRLPQGLFVCVEQRRVIWHESLANMEKYGVDTFPFTEEVFRKKNVEEHKISWNVQSLETLFCCPSADVLFKNPGRADCDEKTSIEQLEKKLVGVYLCLRGDSIPALLEFYEVCKANNIEFEIVVVYCHSTGKNSSMKLFQEHINSALRKRNISWWVLPYNGWVSRRLKRLLYSADKDDLIIVGNGVVDPYGADFIRLLKYLQYQRRVSSKSYVSGLIEGVILEFIKSRNRVQCSAVYPACYYERLSSTNAFYREMLQKLTGVDIALPYIL